ncbi:MAG: IS110 family transposase [Treponema sp.]|nr:IS110 family transposase [Treponema sp.]
MESVIYVGIDVHKDTYYLSSFLPEKNLIFAQTEMKADSKSVMKYLDKVSDMNNGAVVLSGYEAGPTGFKLCRDLIKWNYNCVVMAPTSIAKTTRDKMVKTDKADSVLLAKSLAFHSYKQVVLPNENIEALREVVRMRHFAQKECKRAKQSFLSFLLSNGFSYPYGGKNTYWSKKFMLWVNTIHFNSEYLNFCKEEYLAEAVRMIQRVKTLDKKLEELQETEEIKDKVRALKCISGINTLTAMTLITEVGDFNRFKTAGHFASYTGLCPGSHSSGLTDRSTGITKQGNRIIRRLLIESAKAIRRSCPQKSEYLLKRQMGMPSEIINYADKASSRLRRRMRRLDNNGLNYNKVSAACARELACFVWGMMTNHIA